MGRKINETDHKAAIFFRLRDEDNWEMLSKLMTLPQYQKNRAKLINDALSIGLPALIEMKFGEVKYIDEPEIKTEPETVPKEIISSSADGSPKEIISLLNEIVINTSLGKSMLCGLFNVKELEQKGIPVRADKFSRGQYNNTPDCLFGEEIDMLKDLSKKEEDK